jgi:hypothetical protein
MGVIRMTLSGQDPPRLLYRRRLRLSCVSLRPTQVLARLWGQGFGVYDLKMRNEDLNYAAKACRLKV